MQLGAVAPTDSGTFTGQAHVDYAAGELRVKLDSGWVLITWGTGTIQDAVRAILQSMLSGNDTSKIAVTYQTDDHTIDFIVDSNVRRIFTGTSATPPTQGVAAGDLYFQRSS